MAASAAEGCRLIRLHPRGCRRIGHVHLRRQFREPTVRAFIDWLKRSAATLSAPASWAPRSTVNLHNFANRRTWSRMQRRTRQTGSDRARARCSRDSFCLGISRQSGGPLAVGKSLSAQRLSPDTDYCTAWSATTSRAGLGCDGVFRPPELKTAFVARVEPGAQSRGLLLMRFIE
jgi:hypothetical protein